MPDTDHSPSHKRTAVLVVHGIGSQRALETVRGVIRGVWLDSENPHDKGRRIWTHPERDGADIDLSVMTTNEVPDSKDKRSVDFHELYWAHLMSETKPVAVLLWLYELCRKGPIMKPGTNGLWWAAAIFLGLMNLSFALLALRGVFLFSQTSPQSMLVAPFLLILSCVVFGLLIAVRWQASRLIELLAKFCAGGLLIAGAYFGIKWLVPGSGDTTDGADLATIVALPTLTALLATYLLMGQQGLRAFWRALWVSAAMFFVFLCLAFAHPAGNAIETVVKGWPWSLNSPWSSVLAWAVIGLYLAVNAAFLQPYLGDAARYFRNS